MEHMGVLEKPCVTGPKLTITQTLPVIPDNDYITKIEETVKTHYANSNSDVDVIDCKFSGYKKFLEREVDIEE